MPLYTAFIHAHPVLATLSLSHWADRFVFTTVDPATFDPQTQLTHTKRFVLITTDHLAYYNKAHNSVDTFPFHTSSAPTIDLVHKKLALAHTLLCEAAQTDNRSPLLCFVDAKEVSADPLYAAILRSQFSVEQYVLDDKGNVDVEQIAKSAQKKLEGSGRDIFLVKRGEQYTVHRLGSSVSHTLVQTSHTISMLQTAACSFDDIPQIDAHMPVDFQDPSLSRSD
ncbi:hypothetical protein LPJ73_006528 [Coemansia sp. RSA 2703]|nr:hypothetical protein LPJ73_006528 [Coemansia sp. RSA 2703]